MDRIRVFTTAATVLGAVVLSQPAAAQVACPQGVFEEAAPPVNGDHIFCGEINKKGKATGFHSRPGGVNPATVTGPAPTRNDTVYTLNNFTITVGAKSGNKPISTMYPDTCDQKAVIAAIRNAATTGKVSGKSFEGSSGTACTSGGKPFTITGFFDEKDPRIIKTAWPK